MRHGFLLGGAAALTAFGLGLLPATAAGASGAKHARPGTAKAGPAQAGPARAGHTRASATAGRASGPAPGFRGVPRVSPISDISKSCAGQNAEVEQATDPARGYVYEEWMGCGNRIAFARSTDGGLHFSRPIVLPDSAGGWDPSLAVAPNGDVYAAFMNGNSLHTFPVVTASFDHGLTFPQVTPLVPRQRGNWGDRDFLAVGPAGTLYLTWDYGPSAKAVKFICTKGGSCAFLAGDLNVVIQKSTDGGKHWGPIVHVSPGFPASGADSAPLLVQRNGRIDILYQGYRVTNRKTFTLAPAHSYFTSSVDGGAAWSAPVRIGPRRLTMSLAEWWIDGSLAMDAAGNLYATWDTQSGTRDVGWLSFSRNHGRTWSRLWRVTPDRDNAVHIVEVTAGRPGIAYAAWLADSSRRGYAEYLRIFSISRGWVSGPLRVSQAFGKRTVWPGDTFGISTLPGQRQPGPPRLVLSWGSAVGKQRKPPSEIFAAVLTFR